MCGVEKKNKNNRQTIKQSRREKRTKKTKKKQKKKKKKENKNKNKNKNKNMRTKAFVKFYLGLPQVLLSVSRLRDNKFDSRCAGNLDLLISFPLRKGSRNPGEF